MLVRIGRLSLPRRNPQALARLFQYEMPVGDDGISAKWNGCREVIYHPLFCYFIVTNVLKTV